MQRPRPAPDPHYRPFRLAPGLPITIEVHCVDGGVALVHGTVDAVPFSLGGELAQRVVIRDAVARPLHADPRAA